MNSNDKKYIEFEMAEAEKYKRLSIKHNQIDNANYWDGYLNGLKLLKISYLRNYK